MPNNNKHSILVLAIILLPFSYTSAQTSRFNAGFVAGLNFAELEGNGITDYFGLNAGILGSAKITKHSRLGMEILFSQNGEYIIPAFYPALQYGQVWLNHVEVPVHIDWLIGVFQRDKFYDWNFNLGLAYTKLVNYKIKTIYDENISDQVIYLNKDAIVLQAGTTYSFTKRMGMNFKASLPIRKKELSWTLALRLIYNFN